MKELVKNLLAKMDYEVLDKRFMASGISLARDLESHVDLKEFNTVFDIGANIGNMSKHFVRIFPEATIHAFEPVSSTFDILSGNLRGRPRVKLHQLGFSDTAGKFRIYLQKDHGLNSINPLVNHPDKNNEESAEEIEVRTVDGFCRDYDIKKIDFLKTDAEGLDLNILKGANGLFEKKKIRFVFSEVGFGPDNIRNTSFQELMMFLYSRGFKLRGIYDQSNWGGKEYLTCANALFMLQG